jgi:hypothetical protein
MPRIGDPSVFAIDVEDDSTPQSPRGTLWGHARVWINGFPLGDYRSTHCGLSGFHLNLRDLSDNLPRLTCSDIASTHPDLAFEFLNSKVYGEDATSDAEVALDAAVWSRFVFLTNSSEAFNKLNGFVHYVPGSSVRILVRQPDPDTIRTVTLPLERFRSVVREFDEWATPRSAV